MKESNIFKTVLMAATSTGNRIFRINVGRAWTGNVVIKNPSGSITIKDPRPFITGVPKGFSDGVGWTRITITPEMVGKEVAVFTVTETKTKKGKPSTEQINFINVVSRAGGIAGVIRSAQDYLDMISRFHTALTKKL